MKKILKTTLILAVLMVTVLAFTQNVEAEKRRGVMGCNAAGFGSVGSRLPSGSHVPVWDYAVSLNTNILIYKECILDGVVNALRQAVLGKMIQAGFTTVNTGFGGDPQFVTNLPIHLKERKLNPRAKEIYTGKETDNLCAPFKNTVRTSLQEYYAQKTNKPYQRYSCTADATKQEACFNGDFYACGGIKGLSDLLSNPSNLALFAQFEAEDYLNASLAAEKENEITKLNWGRGFRSAEKKQDVTLADGTTVTIDRIITPGYLIAEYASELLGTGLRQMENADEIDEVIGKLMSNLGTRVIADGNGLAGIEPFLGAIVEESYSEGKSRLVELTLNSLRSAITNENTIKSSLEDVVQIIIKAKTDIRATDLQCLDKMVAIVEKKTRTDLCMSTIGTTTACAVTKSREYDTSKVETFESSRQKVSMMGYAKTAGTVSTKYKKGGTTKGLADTSTGGSYLKYTSPGQDLSSLPNGTISPYATKDSHTTSGNISFTKTLVGTQSVYKFSYDLPDVTVTAVSPVSSTTTASTVNVILSLEKNHSESEIESVNAGSVGYETLKTVYGHINTVDTLIKQLESAKTELADKRSTEAVNAAEAILNNARTDSASFKFAEDMKSKKSSIAALPAEIKDCWTSTDGSGCGSPKWCTDTMLEANWVNYKK